MTDVTRDRPQMPEGYGVPETDEGLLDWPTVEARLVASPQYWMATTRPDGRPHVVPRWGAWLDGGLYYDGAPTTVHVRNLTADPACTLHLESGWEAVIVDGTSAPASPPGLELGARIAEAIGAKYGERGYSPKPDAWEGEAAGGLVRFTPQRVLAWLDFPNDVTRFRFPPPWHSPARTRSTTRPTRSATAAVTSTSSARSRPTSGGSRRPRTLHRAGDDTATPLSPTRPRSSARAAATCA